MPRWGKGNRERQGGKEKPCRWKREHFKGERARNEATVLDHASRPKWTLTAANNRMPSNERDKGHPQRGSEIQRTTETSTGVQLPSASRHHPGWERAGRESHDTDTGDLLKGEFFILQEKAKHLQMANLNFFGHATIFSKEKEGLFPV